MVAEPGGRENGELLFNSSRISVWQDEKSSGDGGNGCSTNVNVFNTIELYAYKQLRQ